MPKHKTLDALIAKLLDEDGVSTIHVYAHYGKNATDTARVVLDVDDSELPEGHSFEGKYEIVADTIKELRERTEDAV